ncbi:hypothetical protein OOK13_07210 [Streptomyces sp. NBC_00378]|uniref:hypothetical protein n=1 Tax=unclassified Streptomyces TaxID=2593676 RepID=UPI002259C79E|nr:MULTISPECIES: hypothetical protein [unclassified Streptomyces]MCX5108316.1 hypothetical protein [Streptomyces sp. NBC_00378]
MVRPLLPPGELLADEHQKVRPVVTSWLPRLARMGHGVAGELELPGQSADASHDGAVAGSHGCEIEVLQSLVDNPDDAREGSVVKVDPLDLLEASGGLECLLEVVTDELVAEEVGCSVRDIEHERFRPFDPAPSNRPRGSDG